MADNTIIIEVGGDHGDGNVELIQKPKGVRVIIRDFDNAYIPEGHDAQDEAVPEVREYETDTVI